MSNDPYASFLRQRRNLIGISLFMSLLIYLGVEIRELNFFGNKITVDDPNKATHLLWVGWTYFLLRYYQYFKACERNEFRQSLNSRLFELTKSQAEKLVRKEWEAKDFSETEWFSGYSHETDKVKVLALEISRYKNYPHYHEFGPTRIELQRTKSSGMKDKEEVKHHGAHIKIERPLLTLYRIRSFFHTLFHTRAATEFYLPFAVAAIPIAMTIIEIYQNKSCHTTPTSAPR